MEAHCPYNGQPCATVHGGQLPQADAFFAYPSQPQRRVDAVQGAIGGFRNLRGNDSAIDWSDLSIEGQLIFCAICEGIRKSSCVVADISGLNFNVLFEFGFAIGCGKPVWPLVEDKEEEIRMYSDFRSLSTIGHSRYRNSKDIITKLSKKKPWQRKAHLTMSEQLTQQPSETSTSILYLQSPTNDEASLRITDALIRPRLNIITDDPGEISLRPITWYIDKLKTSYAVVIDLGPSSDDGDLLYHQAKCALVAGIATASGRRLLILGQGWETAPIDYADLLHSYNSAGQAASIATSFASQLETAIAEIERHESSALTPIPGDRELLLSRIGVGEYIAEDELPDLGNYFVESSQSESLMKGGFNIVVGRKGTGKSALAHVSSDRLRQRERVAVRVIRPKGYELKQVLEVVKKTNLSTGGVVVNALWRYALGTEALAAIWEGLETRRIDAPWSVPEARIRDAMEGFPGLVEYSFASRIALLAQQQHRALDENATVPEAHMLGQLQSTQLKDLRNLVCGFLTAEDWQLSLVVDDIVPTWKSTRERTEYAELLLSFIEASRELWREWNEYLGRHNGKPMSLMVFIRSDIFGSILNVAQEQDRIAYDTLQWEDIDSLLDLIARRIDASFPEERLYWPDILHEEFPYDALKEFIAKSVLYRPRDLIYFFSRVIYYANRRKARAIEIRDLSQAAKDYSDYAFRSLAAEWFSQIPNVEDLLLEFLGGRSELSYDALRDILLKAGVVVHNIDEAVRFLVESQFLGISVDDYSYRYATTPTQGEIMMRQANRFVHDRGGVRRFQIHKAFHHSLYLH